MIGHPLRRDNPRAASPSRGSCRVPGAPDPSAACASGRPVRALTWRGSAPSPGSRRGWAESRSATSGRVPSTGHSRVIDRILRHLRAKADASGERGPPPSTW